MVMDPFCMLGLIGHGDEESKEEIVMG